ncbi:MAG: phosphonate ABC transporter, permease protein PhnE [Culicoidibacterales bacterium]
MQKNIKEQLAKQPKTWIFQIVSALIFVILMAWSTSALNFAGFSEGGSEITKNIFFGIFNPDTDLLFNLTKQGVPYLLLETMSIAFLGTIVGGVIAIPISFLSASNIVPKPVAFIGRAFIMVVRTVPVFVYGLMFIRVTGPGPFAGLLTMSLASVGMVSKMYIEAIEDMDIRILESLDACGCTTFQKIRYGILPQLMPDFISTIIYRFDMNLRDATVLGLVGAGGIGSPLIFAMNAYRWSEVGAILAGLIILVLIIEFISGKIRVKLARG